MKWLCVLAALASSAAFAAPDPSGVLFTQRCSGCHTIGDGPRVGPDLKGVTERRQRAWADTFVHNPSRAIDSGDPIASDLVKRFNGIRMPAQALTPAEFDGLWGYFARCTQVGGCKPTAAGPKFGTDASGDEIARGRALFEGTERFASGGPACIGCHHVRDTGALGGGTIGPDLTFAYARLGERKLNPLLAELSTPLMRPLYGARAPLEANEQYAVKAYLAQLSRDGTPPAPERDLGYLGFAGLAALVGLFGVISAKRGQS